MTLPTTVCESASSIAADTSASGSRAATLGVSTPSLSRVQQSEDLPEVGPQPGVSWCAGRGP
jgi:hypothetical protein